MTTQFYASHFDLQCQNEHVSSEVLYLQNVEIAALKEEMNALPDKGEIKLARKSAGAGERLRHVSPTEMADSALVLIFLMMSNIVNYKTAWIRCF